MLSFFLPKFVSSQHDDWSVFQNLTCVLECSKYGQDAVSDLMHNWVAQRPDFKSALRVVEIVLNTQWYQYLRLTMWFHAKKSKETLKKSKSQNLLCKFGSRAQKWPKIAQKNRSLDRYLLKLFYRHGIYWMLLGESSCPHGSEYVWQRWVGVV